jgi:hypothetical protein
LKTRTKVRRQHNRGQILQTHQLSDPCDVTSNSLLKPPGPAYYDPSLYPKEKRSFHLNRHQTWTL